MEKQFLYGDAGAISAEYALITLAGAAIAGVIYLIVTSDWAAAALRGLIERALSVGT